jgi:hypothetical protein
MAKKVTGAKKVQATAKPRGRSGVAVRLDLSEADHERLDRQARKRGLSKASYARMVILEKLNKEDGTE